MRSENLSLKFVYGIYVIKIFPRDLAYDKGRRKFLIYGKFTLELIFGYERGESEEFLIFIHVTHKMQFFWVGVGHW